MSIEIKITRDEEPNTGGEPQIVYRVQVGPDGHVCTTTRNFYVGLDEDETEAQADAFAQGARAALATAAGLAQRFLDASSKTERNY